MKLFIVTGQTATGKTDHALTLADQYNGELINFDSRQIYKHLDIITGKDLPTSSFKHRTSINGFEIGYYPISTSKIWLYDIVAPDQYFSSFDYVNCAMPLVESVIKRGKTPILVGGTYLYIKHLLYGIDENIPPDWRLREQLKNKSVKELQSILSDLNVRSLKRLNNSEKNNPQRLIRKIEREKSGKRRSRQKKKKETLLTRLKLDMDNIQMIGLKFKKKSDVIGTIESRVEKRMRQGAVEEVKNLLKKGYKETDPGLKTIGYQQLIAFLKGSTSKDEAIADWIHKEVQYAKRQYTFMKNDTHIVWKEM